MPIRLTLTTFAKYSSSCGPRARARRSAQPIPAQQTEIRSPPSACGGALDRGPTASASVTSAATKAAPISAASSSPRSGLRSAIVTAAPAAASARAVAAPRPEAPPATSAPAPRTSIARTLDDRAFAGSQARNRYPAKVIRSPPTCPQSRRPRSPPRLEEARRRTLELVEPLDEAQLNRVYSPILSPLAWDLGHIANFEELWLVRTIGGRPPLHGELGQLLRRDREPAQDPRRAADPARRRAPRLHGRRPRPHPRRAGGGRPLRRRGGPAAARRLRLRDAARPRAPAQRDDAAAPAAGRRLRAGRRLGTSPVPGDGPATIAIPAGSHQVGAPARAASPTTTSAPATRSSSPPSRSTEPR